MRPEFSGELFQIFFYEISYFLESFRMAVFNLTSPMLHLNIPRTNSGIKNRINVFVWAFFLFQKLRTLTVNDAYSGDIKLLIRFHENLILKI